MIRFFRFAFYVVRRIDRGSRARYAAHLLEQSEARVCELAGKLREYDDALMKCESSNARRARAIKLLRIKLREYRESSRRLEEAAESIVHEIDQYYVGLTLVPLGGETPVLPTKFTRVGLFVCDRHGQRAGMSIVSQTPALIARIVNRIVPANPATKKEPQMNAD